MNPYYQLPNLIHPNLVHPTHQPDFRALESQRSHNSLDGSVSRTAYRFVEAVDRVLFRKD